MPLIPFPKVPNLPGVPNLPQDPLGAPFAQFGLNLTSQASADSAQVPIHPKWQISDEFGAPLLTPDSVVDFEYRSEQKVPNYPVEEGSFATYNKVSMPFDVRMTCTCNGHGAMSKEFFLAAIDVYLNNLQLLQINTPDASYGPVNLVHVDYRRESRQGVSLLIVQLWFQEIRQAQSVTAETAFADLAAPVQLGQVATVAPTAAQAASISTKTATAAAIQSSSTFLGLAASIPAITSTLSAIPGASGVTRQLIGMASVAGNINKVINGAVGPAMLGSIPSRMGDLAGSLSAATGGNPAAVAAITSVISDANAAADVAKLASITIQ